MQKIFHRAALGLGCLLLYTWVTSAAAGSSVANANANPGAQIALTRFVSTMLASNPRVQAARAALDAGVAFEAAASRPLYNPSLDLYAENAVDQTRSLGISQTIDWGGKRSARTDVAAADRLAAEAQYLAVRRSVMVELLSGLAVYHTTLQRNALAVERERLMRDFAAVTRRRFDAGDLNRVEYNLASLAFVDARMQKATIAAALADSKQQIRNLSLGTTPDQWPTLGTQAPALPAAAEDPQTTVLALPEVQVVQRRVEAATAQVELRKREQRLDPTISLEGGREDNTTLIGLNLSIPLPVRNRFSYEVTAASARKVQAQQLADDVMRRAYARLISASERYQLTRGAWQDWEQTGQVNLRSQAEQLQRLWEVGDLSSTEFLVQLRQTIDTRESALDLGQTLWNTWFEWLAAAGQLDRWLRLEAKL